MPSVAQDVGDDRITGTLVLNGPCNNSGVVIDLKPDILDLGKHYYE